MSGTTAILQTPVGFLVDRHGARPLVGGLLMSLSVRVLAGAPALAMLSGVGNSVIHPADYTNPVGLGRQGSWPFLRAAYQRQLEKLRRHRH